MSQHDKNHIIIIGGGVAGLTLALALGQADIHVTLVEQQAPVLTWPADSWDARTVAINATSLRILENLNVWQRLPVNRLGPLRALCVWDPLGGGEVHFNSHDSGEGQLGYIVENRWLLKALWEALYTCPAVNVVNEVAPTDVKVTEGNATLTLSNAQTLTGVLIIGADGGQSWLRRQMQVSLQHTNYQQQAFIAIAASEKSHQHTGWQSFLTTGPLAWLPLFNEHTGAIIWSADDSEHQRLQQLSPELFNQALAQGFEQRLGHIKLLTPLHSIALVERRAAQYIKPRLALIGDAAHTIHPLAGQGANLGLMDAACLAAAIFEARQRCGDLGSWRVLRRYECWRKNDNACMATVMSAFKSIFAQSATPVVYLRSLALQGGDRLTLMKRWLMQQAAGRRGELPPLAQTR